MPTTEPDERSTPPVMMTWVTPTAMMPMTATCRIITVRRCWFIKKLWPTKIQPSSSKNSAMPINTRKMFASGGSLRFCCISPPGRAAVLAACSVDMVLLPSRFPCGLVRREFHDLDLVRFRAVEEARHAPFMHHHDAVAHAEHLRHFRRDHDDGDSLAGQARDQFVD